MYRTEYGFERTSCSCKACVTNCRFMPGFLIPSDLDRMVDAAHARNDVFTWAEQNLLASPGALVRIAATGEITRIPTLVPATKPDGSCIHLTDDNLCRIHDVAPFGCAFFSCGPEPEGLAAWGILRVHEARAMLYGAVWRYLHAKGKLQHKAEILRARMRASL